MVATNCITDANGVDNDGHKMVLPSLLWPSLFTLSHGLWPSFFVAIIAVAVIVYLMAIIVCPMAVNVMFL